MTYAVLFKPSARKALAKLLGAKLVAFNRAISATSPT